MTETEAIVRIVSELHGIRFALLSINIVLWFILGKRCYSHTDGIEDAIKELIRLIRSRR